MIFLTPDQAAEKLGVSKRMLLDSAAPRRRWGHRTIRFHESDLEEWARNVEVEEAKEPVRGNLVLRMVGGPVSPFEGDRSRGRTGRSLAETGVDFQARRLRTTFATLVPANTQGVQSMLGHTSPRTTLAYYQMALPENNRRDVDALEQQLRSKAG